MRIIFCVAVLVLAVTAAARRAGAVDMAKAAKPAPFIVGVNHDFVWTEDEQIDPLIKLLKESGATHVRIPLRWNVVEPEKDKWDWTRVDTVIRKLTDAKIDILAVLMSAPDWANGTRERKVEGWYDAYPPTSDPEWAGFVHAVVTRYRRQVQLWEIWNEQNGVDFYRPVPDARRYVELLKIAYRECKKADPKCVVVMGGLQMNGILANPWSPVKTPNYLQATYDQGGRPYFDVINIHPYSMPRKEEGAQHMRKMIEGTIEVVAKNGDAAKPIWVTEIGCGINPVDTADAQAGLLRDSVETLARMPQVQAVYWFTLADYKQDILGPEGSMGTVTYDFAGKPSFSALQESARKWARP